MDPKGYDHPLHSLQLIPHGQIWQDEARYAIPLPQGRLVVAPALRERATRIRTWSCDHAVAIVLSRHDLRPEAFTTYGLDLAWSRNMKYWHQRMLEQHQLIAQLDTQRRLDAGALASQVQQLREGWIRLSTAARMAGLGGLITHGQAPRGPALHGAFAEALGRAGQPGHAPLLARFGVDPAQLLLLQRLHQDHEQARTKASALFDAISAASAQLIVMRAALLGDLSMLCQFAPLVFSDPKAMSLQMNCLFPGRWTSGGAAARKTAAPVSPTPAAT